MYIIHLRHSLSLSGQPLDISRRVGPAHPGFVIILHSNIKPACRSHLLDQCLAFCILHCPDFVNILFSSNIKPPISFVFVFCMLYFSFCILYLCLHLYFVCCILYVVVCICACTCILYFTLSIQIFLQHQTNLAFPHQCTGVLPTKCTVLTVI